MRLPEQLAAAVQTALFGEDPAVCAALGEAAAGWEARAPDPDVRDWAAGLAADVAALLAHPAERNGPWVIEPLPDEAAGVPSMAGDHARRYYTWLARTATCGGEVVELGCWMGGVTTCLAGGLRQSLSRGEGRVHAFDAFRWHEWMDEAIDDEVLAGRALDYSAGDDFFDDFVQACAPFGGLVVPRRAAVGPPDAFGGLAPMTWDGGPVDVLVNDLWDDEDVTEAAWAAFSPALVPGRSVVVMHQFALARSTGLRRFCRRQADRLRPLHKPQGPAKAFLFLG